MRGCRILGGRPVYNPQAQTSREAIDHERITKVDPTKFHNPVDPPSKAKPKGKGSMFGRPPPRGRGSGDSADGNGGGNMPDPSNVEHLGSGKDAGPYNAGPPAGPSAPGSSSADGNTGSNLLTDALGTMSRADLPSTTLATCQASRDQRLRLSGVNSEGTNNDESG